MGSEATHGFPGPFDCPKCGKIHKRARCHKSNGEPCGRWPRRGALVCDSHGAAAPKARAKAEVRATVMEWGLTDTHVDPSELMLRLVAQASVRVSFLSGLLGEAYEAAERLRAAGEAPQHDLLAAETARLDLERIFNTGGVGVLIGYTYSADKEAGIFATGEAIRGLAKLEAEERERAFTFASKAKAAGIAAEQLELYKRLGAQFSAALLGMAAALGHRSDDPLVVSLAQAQIGALLGGGNVIEGPVAA